MIKMKSCLWKRGRASERARGGLNLNERFRRSDNTIPIWMASFMVGKEEANLRRFNSEVRRLRTGQVHECVCVGDVLSAVFLEHDWNVQACPSANCLRSTCNLPTGHLRRALYIWSVTVCLNGRVGGIHFGADGRKQTASDRDINTEGWVGWWRRSCFLLSHLLIFLLFETNHRTLKNPGAMWLLISCTMRWIVWASMNTFTSLYLHILWSLYIFISGF